MSNNAARRSSTPATSSVRWPRRRSATSTHRGHWLGQTVTKVSEAGRFWEDGAKDQDYFLRYPDYPDGSKLPFPRDGAEAANREAVA
jgi:hypothetical protein